MRERHTARLAVGATLLLVAGAAFPGERRTVGRIERTDPGLDRLIPRDAVIEVLAEGFRWSEGPVWEGARGRLLFSDVPNNVVHAWSEKDGLSSFLKPSGYTGPEGGGGREPGANGLAFDAQGRLVLCQHGDRRLSRLEGGRFVPLAERFEGKRFNSPNDLVFGRDGSLYFTDPPYGLTKTFDDPGREIGWNGVYRIGPDGAVSVLVKDLKAPNGIGLSPDGGTLYVGQSDGDRPVVMAYDLAFGRDGSLYFTDPPYGLTKTFDDPGREIGWNGVYRLSPEGRVSVLVKDLKAPNGIGLSPDGGTLYVGQSDGDRPVVMAYDLAKDGTVSNGRVFFDTTPLKKNGPGAPDGMKVDRDGNVFTTGPGGVLVLSPEAKHLGTIVTGVPTANCAFGDDGSTLYITANAKLCRVRTTTKGQGF